MNANDRDNLRARLIDQELRKAIDEGQDDTFGFLYEIAHSVKFADLQPEDFTAGEIKEAIAKAVDEMVLNAIEEEIGTRYHELTCEHCKAKAAAVDEHRQQPDSQEGDTDENQPQ